MKKILLVLLSGYLGLVVLTWSFQRSLFFKRATLTVTTPKDFGHDYRSVQFYTEDGAKLSGWWLAHPEHEPARPVLLYFHSNGAALSSYAEVAGIFYDLGWDALLFDYREFGESTSGKIPLSEAGLVADGEAAYNWLLRKNIDPSQIIFWGHSLGSAVAAHLSSKVQIAGLVLEGSFPSTYEMARLRYPWMIIFPWMIWDPFETANYVKNHKFQLLVMHSGNDTVVPLSMGKEVFENASQPKELLIIEGINHADFPSVHEKYSEYLKKFGSKIK